MAERRTPTVPFPADLLEEVDSQLEYGDSRAAWIRDACRDKLEREGTDVAEATTDAPAES